MTALGENTVHSSAAPGRRAVCTYFDSNYLSRGIVMLSSLILHNRSLAVFVLCFDETVEKVLNAWFGSRITTISLQRLHRFEPRLPDLRAKRSAWEFYATHKAPLVAYVMSECGPFEWTAVIDADTAFFGSLSLVLDEIGAGSIGLSPHRFPPGEEDQEKYGKFNAGFICFRDDPASRLCLSDWREDCITWCRRKPLSDGRFMNQGYLSRWPERYPNVVIIRHPGVNLAPWNLRSHRIEFTGGVPKVDGYPLIFYHYSGLLRDRKGRWRSMHGSDFETIPGLSAKLYAPYLRAVEAVRQKILDLYGLSGTGSVRFKAGR